jgi:hypothetical protein
MGPLPSLDFENRRPSSGSPALCSHRPFGNGTCGPVTSPLPVRETNMTAIKSQAALLLSLLSLLLGGSAGGRM